MGTAAEAASLTIGSRTVRVSNLAKPLYPSGFTKGDVANYYVQIAPVLLPHLAGRAITWKRYPNGATSDYFFEKHCPSHRPDWVQTADVPSSRHGNINHCVIDDVAALLWAANLAALELHAPLARAAQPDRPTTLVFDLDPGAPATLLDCLEIGLQLRDRLRTFDLDSVAKTSGGKGLHLYVPLNTAADFDQTKTFARRVADDLVAALPTRVTANMSKAQRPGKIFVDWSQNDQHKTTAAPYTLRAGPVPRVSTPISWAEAESALKKRSADSLAFDPAQAVARSVAQGDLFAPLLTLKQKLPKPPRPR